MSAHSYYPVALDLAQRRVLVVGGGLEAEKKMDGLLRAGADLTVVSPAVRPSIQDLADSGRLTLRPRPYITADLDDVYLAIAATDDVPVNAAISADARARGIIVNAVDDPPNCDFFAVAIVRRGDLQVSISTNGRSPAFARWMRESLDASLPLEYGLLLDVLGDVRSEIKATGPIPAYEHWRAAITEDVFAALRNGDRGAARQLVYERVTRGLPRPTPGLEALDEIR